MTGTGGLIKLENMILFSQFPSWIREDVFSFLPIKWYAVMYIVAFSIAYIFFRVQCKKDRILNSMDADTTQTAFLYVIIGLIVGARVFATLLYNGTSYYWTHPWLIFWPFRNGRFIGLPGMSYHGGLVGAFIGAILFCRKYRYVLLDFADAITASVPLGYTFGRLGNFINGELWGRCTGTNYGMVFPYAPKFSTNLEWVRNAADAANIEYKIGDLVNLPRHPSQLYEAFFEGIFLFLVIWFIVRPLVRKKYNHGPGMISGCYFIGYGLIRFIIEYFREPDEQLGFIIALGKETEPTALFKSALNISMGQILCFLMIVVGVLFIFRSLNTQPVVYSSKGKKK